MVNPLLNNTTCVDQPPDPTELQIPDLYPSCAVTRAMVKKAMLNGGKQDIGLTDNLYSLGQSFNDDVSNSLSPSQFDIILTLTTVYCPSNPIYFLTTKVMTLFQGHSFAKNNTVIQRSHLCLKGFR